MESQTVEWKELWHDDYMKTICAFANTQGGIIEIGRTDSGKVVDITGAMQLLEVLPNKIRNALGIIPDVKLLNAGEKQYIAIEIEPFPYPISFRGKYYIRSGSTTQELTGNPLNSFLLQKQGKTWDGVPMPQVKFDDFESDAFKIFRRKALDSTRLSKDDLEVSDEVLLKRLMLIEGDYLKRAAVLLFHQNPEQWVVGAYVKIGYFENSANLLFQDEIHGSLIAMPDKVMETVYTKYFKGIISYKGIQRVEIYPVPHAAFREAVLNAIVHKDYSTGNPIHIHIYPDKVLIFNDGQLPANWTEEDLQTAHTSIPYNPMIASTFFRSGMIEAWGRGVEKMKVACKAAGKPEPFYKARTKDIMIGFYTENNYGNNFGKNFGINSTQEKILVLMTDDPKITAQKIADSIGLTKRNVEYSINMLKKGEFIERIGSAKGGYWVVKRTIQNRNEY